MLPPLAAVLMMMVTMFAVLAIGGHSTTKVAIAACRFLFPTITTTVFIVV